jgi:hypothetical protein
MKLKRIPNQARIDKKNESFIARQAAGLCLDFHKTDSNMYDTLQICMYHCDLYIAILLELKMATSTGVLVRIMNSTWKHTLVTLAQFIKSSGHRFTRTYF